MPTIRNACRALIIKDGKMLLHKNRWEDGTFYYDLPGGGQNPYETLEEAVKRECLEETGRAVDVGRLLCVHESISMSESARQKLPDRTHIVFFVFECSLTDAPPVPPTEPDANLVKTVWLPLAELPGANFSPPKVKEYILGGINPDTIRHLPAAELTIKE